MEVRRFLARREAQEWKNILIDEYVNAIMEGADFVEHVASFLRSNSIRHCNHFAINNSEGNVEIFLVGLHGKFNFTFKVTPNQSKVSWKKEGF